MGKKVLVVSNCPPLHDHGWGIRTVQILEHWKDLGYQPEVYIIYPEHWGPIGESMLTIAKEYGLAGLSYSPKDAGYYPIRHVVKELKNIEKHYDYLIFRFEHIAFKAGFYLYKKPVIIDYDDFDFPIEIRLRAKVKAYVTIRLATVFSRKIFVLQKSHLKFFGKRGIHLPVLSMNAIKENMMFEKSRTSFPSILFVGQQVGELIQFLHHKWAILKSSIPDLVLYVISKWPVDEADRGIFDGVLFLRNVDDVQEYYCKAWASLLVSKHHAGSHIKILESLIFKTPVVTLQHGIRGYEVINNEEEIILGCENYDELALRLVQMLNDEELIEKLSEKGKIEAAKYFSIDSISENLYSSLHA